MIAASALLINYSICYYVDHKSKTRTNKVSIDDRNIMRIGQDTYSTLLGIARRLKKQTRRHGSCIPIILITSRGMSSLPLDPSQETISLIHDIDMPKPQLINSRKRQRSEQSPRQPLSKRKKYRSPQPQPAFWDNLSKSWLTKRALRELDRRNAQSASNSPSPTQRPHQTLTRHALTELKKYGQPNQLTPGLLYDCSPSSLKDIKLFARHGGPNLTDLRGVRRYHQIPTGASDDHILYSIRYL